MRDRAVVALEVVLESVLPVDRKLPGDAPAEAERLEVDAALLDELAHAVEVVVERVGLRVGVREHERPPGRRRRPGRARTPPGRTSGSRSERGARSSDPSRSYVQAWYGHCSVARQPSPSRDEVRAVAADVLEPAQHAVLGAHDDDRHVPDAAGEVAPRLGDRRRAPDVLPGVREDPLALERVDLRDPSTTTRGASSRRRATTTDRLRRSSTGDASSVPMLLRSRALRHEPRGRGV